MTTPTTHAPKEQTISTLTSYDDDTTFEFPYRTPGGRPITVG